MALFSSTIRDIVSNRMPQPYYHFDGSGDYIEISNNSNLNSGYGDITYAIWFRSTSSATQYLLSKGGNANPGLEIELRSGNFGAYIRTSGGYRVTPAGTAAIDGKWHLGVVTLDRDGDAVQYLDGVAKKTTSISGYANETIANTLNMYISTDRGGGASIDGEVSSVKIYNRALSSTEVKELYSGESIPYKYRGAVEKIDGNPTSDFSGGLDGWAAYDSTGFSQSGVEAHIGSNSGYLTGTSGNTRIQCASQTFTVGDLVSGYAWVYMTAGTEVQLRIENNGAWTNLDSTTTSNSWVRLAFTDHVVTDTSDVLSIWIPGSLTKSVYIDDISWRITGAVAEYDGSGISSDKWFDKSGNDLHGTVTNATVENAPSGEEDGLIYETGTWSPTIRGYGQSVAPTYDTNNGRYTRIGNTVIAHFYINMNNNGTMTGNYTYLAGLPFNHQTAHGGSGNVEHFSGLNTSSSWVGIDMSSTNQYGWITYLPSTSGTASTYMPTSVVGDDFKLLGTVTYEVQ